MSQTELRQKIDRMRTVFAEADAKYRKMLEERRTTGTVKKYSPEEMRAVYRKADENFQQMLAELPPERRATMIGRIRLVKSVRAA